MSQFELLIDYTLKCIAESGHTPEDIVYIGSLKSGYSCTWPEFQELCKQQKQEMHSTYDIPYDVVIVFKTGLYMWRHSNENGWEHVWKFQKPITIPSELKKMTVLFSEGFGGEDLEDIHHPKE